MFFRGCGQGYMASNREIEFGDASVIGDGIPK
jgi:hypothetical protein